ncbi:MAG: hypothetical protein WCK32_03840 [Chlorobiaceae bacterium]
MLQQNERLIIKKHIELYFITTLCLAAVLIEPLAYFSFLKPDTEGAASWFQRSGAITSIFSYFAQFRISVFAESIKGSTFAETWWLYNIFGKKASLISWIVAIIGLWGAFVWGYGDLIIK